MSDMFSKISEILANPEASEKIREIAASLSSGNGSSVSADLPSEGESSTAASLGALSLPSASGGRDRELALLNAIRPYMRQSRVGRIDTAIRALRMLDMLRALR